MTIHSTRAKLPGLAASLVAGTLLLAATGSSYAVPQVGSVTVKSEEAIVHAVQGRAHDRGTLYRPPQTIKPAPSPRVRDHRGGGNKTTSSAPGGVTVTTRPPRKPPCNAFDAFPLSCVGGGGGKRDRVIDHRTIPRDHRCKGIECWR